MLLVVIAAFVAVVTTQLEAGSAGGFARRPPSTGGPPSLDRVEVPIVPNRAIAFVRLGEPIAQLRYSHKVGAHSYETTAGSIRMHIHIDRRSRIDAISASHRQTSRGEGLTLTGIRLTRGFAAFAARLHQTGWHETSCQQRPGRIATIGTFPAARTEIVWTARVVSASVATGRSATLPHC